MEMFVLLTNLETSPNFTGYSIPFYASSSSFSHFLYLDTLYESLSAGCKAERIDHRQHLLSSFCAFIIAFY
jgi:hypothetical protein